MSIFHWIISLMWSEMETTTMTKKNIVIHVNVQLSVRKTSFNIEKHQVLRCIQCIFAKGLQRDDTRREMKSERLFGVDVCYGNRHRVGAIRFYNRNMHWMNDDCSCNMKRKCENWRIKMAMYLWMSRWWWQNWKNERKKAQEAKHHTL